MMLFLINIAGCTESRAGPLDKESRLVLEFQPQFSHICALYEARPRSLGSCLVCSDRPLTDMILQMVILGHLDRRINLKTVNDT